VCVRAGGEERKMRVLELPQQKEGALKGS